MRFTVSIALLALFALGAPPVFAETPAPPLPLASFAAPSTGFIDDSFAVRSDGKAIAFVTTDGASPGALHVAEVGGAQRESPGAPATTTRLYWLGDDRVLVVSRTAARLSGVV